MRGHDYTQCPECGKNIETRRMRDRTITAARITGVLQFIAVVTVMLLLCIEWG